MKTNVRTEYLLEQQERLKAARSLAERFPELKTLAATVACFSPDGQTRYSEVKCTFNLGYAKELFLFACPNPECIEGNFDLSSELARAVAERQGSAIGESRCPGWKSKTTMGSMYCDHLLRYTFNLGYC